MGPSSDSVQQHLAQAQATPRLGGPTFTNRFRFQRLLWMVTWRCLAGWTPPQANAWRLWLLRRFGATLADTARVNSRTTVWWPGNLTMGQHSSFGPGANCYNVAPVTIGDFCNVSQGAHLCTASHNIQEPSFALTFKPIVLHANSWVAAETFVGPGVTVGEGAVLGARGVAFRTLQPWTTYAGNPAQPVGTRTPSAGLS
ncbi:putative colanic acid biosynthesis acetyltransferase [Rhizobium sp. CFBP 8762]|uniref:putative colanic acid biosynthesis acetyltransferase n=1 Tax=Rhizobium sp. CFBP 8762 TaxID=2775279 RepID=UPI00177DFF8C|nr:putative colanic acid biosynthesis acetyltransferase [Rhizobium sp. CFBP 8762]MBD8554081.1 putative colanic acid biosynthesis acetyltransferase [Rhizobium sp. CFBP 8762]